MTYVHSGIVFFSKAALARRVFRADKIGAESAPKHAPWKEGFTGVRLSAFSQAALAYTVLVYIEWHREGKCAERKKRAKVARAKMALCQTETRQTGIAS